MKKESNIFIKLIKSVLRSRQICLLFCCLFYVWLVRIPPSLDNKYS